MCGFSFPFATPLLAKVRPQLAEPVSAGQPPGADTPPNPGQADGYGQVGRIVMQPGAGSSIENQVLVEAPAQAGARLDHRIVGA